MRAIVLGGPSGAGKTHLRQTWPELASLPCVDIADVYREHPDYDWALALQEFLLRARSVLRQYNTAVLEGYFLPGSPSLRMLIDDLKVAGVQYEIIHLWAPFDVCQGRLQAALDAGEISAEEYAARARILAAVAAKRS